RVQGRRSGGGQQPTKGVEQPQIHLRQDGEGRDRYALSASLDPPIPVGIKIEDFSDCLGGELGQDARQCLATVPKPTRGVRPGLAWHAIHSASRTHSPHIVAHFAPYSIDRANNGTVIIVSITPFFSSI